MKSTSRSHTISVRAFVLAAVLVAPTVCIATNSVNPSNEVRTERYFQSIRKNYNQLLLFLHEMPKGGDLHNHLLGAVYAESFIQWASDGGLCVDPKTLYLTFPLSVEKARLPSSTAL